MLSKTRYDIKVSRGPKYFSEHRKITKLEYNRSLIGQEGIPAQAVRDNMSVESDTP